MDFERSKFNTNEPLKGQSEKKKNAIFFVKLSYSALKVHERKYLQEPHRELKVSSKSVKGIA